MVDDEQRREYWNCEHLYDTLWRFEVFRKPTPSWDHEHCHVCFRRIAEADYGDPEAVQEAYKYIYPALPAEQTERNEWLCPDCFEELKGTFRWRVANQHDPAP